MYWSHGVQEVGGMDISTLVMLTVIFTFLILLFQRTEAKKRLIVFLLLMLPGVLLRNFVFYRDVHTEGWLALGIALILNLAFWLFIGRYNPVGSSDRIQVIGMDD
jgi:amino acid transporter